MRIAHSKYGMRIAQTADVILQQRTRIEARSPGTNHDQFLVEAIRDMLWSAIDNPYADFDGVLWPMTDLANAAEARNATMRMLAGGTDEHATYEVEFDPIPAPPEAHQTAQLAILRMESELQQQLGEQYNLRQHDLAPDADSDPLARLELDGNRLGWSYNAPGNRAAFGLGLRGQPHRKAWFTTPYRWGSVKNGPK